MSDREEAPKTGMGNTQIVEALSKLSPEQLREALSPAIGRPTKVNGLYWLVLGTACFVLVLCVPRLTGAFILLYPDKTQMFGDLFPGEAKITRDIHGWLVIRGATGRPITGCRTGPGGRSASRIARNAGRHGGNLVWNNIEDLGNSRAPISNAPVESLVICGLGANQASPKPFSYITAICQAARRIGLRPCLALVRSPCAGGGCQVTAWSAMR